MGKNMTENEKLSALHEVNHQIMTILQDYIKQLNLESNDDSELLDTLMCHLGTRSVSNLILRHNIETVQMLVQEMINRAINDAEQTHARVCAHCNERH